MSTWDAAYVNDLPDSAFAVILPGGTKDGEGKTTPRSLRKLPHHDASGSVDMPHLRNAMSREPQTDMPMAMHEKAMGHLERHMEGMGKAFDVKAQPMGDDEERAWFDGRTARRILAIPFGGPIPSPKSTRGVDLDNEFFDERTDIYGPYPGLRHNRERLVDFMHSFAPPGKGYGDHTGMMTGHLLGKSILDPDPEEDGWWADIWFEQGNRRVAMIEALAKRGARLYGSSQPVGKAIVEPDGHIAQWPHWLQTIATTPQNTYSVIRPKAALEAEELLRTEGSKWSAFEAALRSLAPSLQVPPSGAEPEAKAGRVLSATNERDLLAALDALRSGLDSLDAVVRRQPDYRKEPDSE